MSLICIHLKNWDNFLLDLKKYNNVCIAFFQSEEMKDSEINDKLLDYLWVLQVGLKHDVVQSTIEERAKPKGFSRESLSMNNDRKVVQ